MRVLGTNFKGGWFIGDFSPAILQTDLFEVGFKLHKKGESWPVHYHEHCTEYTFLAKGSMQICDCILNAPVAFCLEKHEIADPVFLTDCIVVVVKTPSVPGDKVIVDANL